MSNKSPLEVEATSDDGTTTVEFFDREWTVPTQQLHGHIIESKRILREEGVLDADDIARIYLPAEQYDALVKLNRPGDQLGEFATKIAEALGLGNSGNSEPSSTSS